MMMTQQEERTRLYEVNKDFVGERTVERSQEIVDFQNESKIRIWFNDLAVSFSEHWHKAIEIILPIENYYEACINGETYRVQPGEFLIIPSGSIHSLMAPSSGKRFIFLIGIDAISNIHEFTSIQEIISSPILMNMVNYPDIFDKEYEYLMNMRDLYFNDNDFREMSIYSIFLAFLAKLGQHDKNKDNTFLNSRVYKQTEYAQNLKNIIDYINVHYAEELTLDSVASMAGYSKFYFTRLFREYTGKTFNDYLHFRRIKAAESLLAKPDLSITEIALQSGFCSISTFNRTFRQAKDCTPSEYRLHYCTM